MDYFEKRSLFINQFKATIEEHNIAFERTALRPNFSMSEHHTVNNCLSTGYLASSEPLCDLFIGNISGFNKDKFISKIKKTIKKYSKLLDLNIDFAVSSISTEIELNIDYKDFYDINNISFTLRGVGKKTEFTSFKVVAYLNEVNASYELVTIDGVSLERPSSVVVSVNHKKTNEIVIPMLNAYKDIISEIVGYEVTEVNQDIINVLEMIKI
jgi:hypothetical protein